MKFDLLTEHSSIPGTIYENRLILGDCGAILNEMALSESTDSAGNKATRFRGKFQEAGAINKNRRMYTRDILDENVKKLQPMIENGGLIGELDHPTDSIIHFVNASHKITKLWWENNVLMGEGQILNTPYGKIIKALINDGVRIGISSRGVGSGKVNEDGVLVIGESYKLITFDVVADPSTNSAFQEKIVSSNESIMHKMPQMQQKNENASIYTNKQVLLACLSGIVKKQAQEIKSRLS